MRREIPLFLVIAAGWLMLAEFMSAHLTPLATAVRDWAVILVAVTQIIGVANVGKINLEKISRRREGWKYSFALLGSLLVMIVLGIGPSLVRIVLGQTPPAGELMVGGFRLFGMDAGTLFDKVYAHTYVPLQSTMFSLLAFFIASAAYRAFKIRSPEATILAVTAILVMIGRVPIGETLWSGMPGLTDWIMNAPQLAAKRAILIGAALGAIATGMKVILGLERNFLGE